MLSIGEVAKAAGLRPSALRYYEQAGLLSPAARVSGRRRYEPAVLATLRVIACAQKAGFTIAEVRELISGGADHGDHGDHGDRRDGNASSVEWRALAERKLLEIDALIEKVQATRRLLEESLLCDCVDLERCALVVGATAESS